MADDNETIDPKAHKALADAHERLKVDSKADRDALRALQAQVAELTTAKEDAEAAAAAKAGDVDAIKAQLEAKHQRELKAATDRAAKAEGQVQKLVVDSGLDAALDAANVAPAYKKAAKALLRAGVELKDENGDPVALMDGKPLSEAIKTWAASDEGKAFVLNGNTGGGAPGGNGATGVKPLSEMGDQERLALAREGKLRPSAGA
jgi:hypothetical protein